MFYQLDWLTIFTVELAAGSPDLVGVAIRGIAVAAVVLGIAVAAVTLAPLLRGD